MVAPFSEQYGGARMAGKLSETKKFAQEEVTGQRRSATCERLPS